MNKERLLTLVKFLYSVPRERFNLETWVGNESQPWGGRDDLSCGTTACAIGWGCLIPEFKTAGLSLEHIDGNQGLGVVVYIFNDEGYHCRYESFDAVSRFFDIDVDAAGYLFGSESYDELDWNDPMIVIKRIEEFIK